MTRLIEILISLAIVAALFVIIGVVLPSSRHVTESIETNRKMTIVRDTLSSPRRFKDWNVLALKDPRMEWKFFGPDSGQGAGFEYASNDKQVGKGTGKTVATVGGAVAGGFVGNEVQKHVTSKNVWVTKVKMKDGSIKTFEQEAKPAWAAGQPVKVRDKTLTRL